MTNSKVVPKRGRPTYEAVSHRFAATVELLESYGGLPKPNKTC
jgi:hypothetical protein